jgi:hypothetical protein
MLVHLFQVLPFLVQFELIVTYKLKYWTYELVNQRIGKLVSLKGCDVHQAPKSI